MIDAQGRYRNKYGQYARREYWKNPLVVNINTSNSSNTYLGTPVVEKKPDVDPFEDFVFPENTRYMRRDGDILSVLVEIRPGVNQFRYRRDFEDRYADGAKNYEVAMPWQYFWIHFRKAPYNSYSIPMYYAGVQIFWAKKRITSLDSEVFPAMLPNLCQNETHFYFNYGIGTLCLGAGGSIQGLIRSVEDGARQVIDNTYNSIFNANMRNGNPFPFGDPEVWQEMSKENPYFWMDWDGFDEVVTMPLREALKPSSGKP